MQVGALSGDERRARGHRMLAALWVRIEWLLSGAAAPLAVILMRERGFAAGVRAAALCIGLLALALFELHQGQQWRLAWLGARFLRHPTDAGLARRVELVLRGLPANHAGPLPEPPFRVRALFAEQLALRKLCPLRVRLVISREVELARTRDAGPFHLVELHPEAAAGPASLLLALFAHELAHVQHSDPLVKRVLAGALVPSCTLLAAVSAGMMEGASDSAAPLGIAMALLASATLLPWAYAVLQAVSYAMELRADREAAALCGGPGPVFDLLDCLDDGGQPYRLHTPKPPRPSELVERETNRLLEEVLYLLPAHPPTWERRRRMLSLQRLGPRAGHFFYDALPHALSGTAPLVAALVLLALAVQLGRQVQARPLTHHAGRLTHLVPHGALPPVLRPDPKCHGDPTGAGSGTLCEERLRSGIAALLAAPALDKDSVKEPPGPPRKAKGRKPKKPLPALPL